MSRVLRVWVLVLSVGIWVAACGPSSGPTPVPSVVALGSRPSLLVSAPRDGTIVAVGSVVSVQTSASDPKGIVRIELWVDGVLYREDITKEADGLPSVSVTQTWPATELGNHVLLLKAINRSGVASDPQTINISVVPQTALPTSVPASTPTLAPTPAGTPTLPPATPAATAVAACNPDATFVTDVTVPDGSSYKPGDTINKVWRLRNSGDCVWDSGYQLAFVEGAQMGAAGAVAVPRTTSSATADIAVSMVAPNSPGTYSGKWRMRTPAGRSFGQSVSIVIKVIDLSTPTPTLQPTPGVLTADFSVDRGTIPYADCATLKWDVENASAVKLDNKGVTGHDTRQVCPTDTTDYTLDAYPPTGDPVEKVVTVNVQKPAKNGTTPAIPAGNWMDLTLGTQDSAAASHWDFQWDTTRSLVPKNGATFVWVGTRGFTDVQQSECQNNTGYSAGSLSGAQVGAGSVICFKTHDSHSGKMRILNSDSQLVFQWVTW